METENTIVDESENWNSSGKTMSFKQIVLSHVQRCVLLSSREMKEGFWIYNEVPPSQNSRQKIKYVGDARHEYCQALDTLHDLLMPKFDETIKTSSKETYESLDNLFMFRKTFIKKFREENEEFADERYDYKDIYWHFRLKLYRQLFQELCAFLERLGWLDTGDVED